MKKLISILICMALLYSCTLAEQAVTMPESRYVITVPDSMAYSAPEKQDKGVQAYISDTLEMDYLSYTREDAAAYGFRPTLRETAEKLRESGMEAELREVNGIEMLVYRVTDEADGAQGLGYIFVDGDRFVEVVFWYATEEAAETAKLIMESIRVR